MPDFERVFDQLRLDLSETPEDRARAEGYIAGKNYARKEIAYMVAFFSVVSLLLWAWISV